MELPSTTKQEIDTSKYRLVQTKYGMYVFFDE